MPRRLLVKHLKVAGLARAGAQRQGVLVTLNLRVVSLGVVPFEQVLELAEKGWQGKDLLSLRQSIGFENFVDVDLDHLHEPDSVFKGLSCGIQRIVVLLNRCLQNCDLLSLFLRNRNFDPQFFQLVPKPGIFVLQENDQFDQLVRAELFELWLGVLGHLWELALDIFNQFPS